MKPSKCPAKENNWWNKEWKNLDREKAKGESWRGSAPFLSKIFFLIFVFFACPSSYSFQQEQSLAEF